tara:strand:+ start:1808 stop:2110 length:303 start_codon:yes stop_codon:yes gene_type:complete
MTDRKYITETQIYYVNGSLIANCNSITFINSGSNAVNVDGIPLTTNQSISIQGNNNEINVKTYSFTFESGAGSLIVIRKIFLDDSGKSYANGRMPDNKGC